MIQFKEVFLSETNILNKNFKLKFKTELCQILRNIYK